MGLVWRHRIFEALGYAALVGSVVSIVLGVMRVFENGWVRATFVLAVVGFVLLFLRSRSRSALWIRIHSGGRRASGTITKLRKRGTWGVGGSESSPAEQYTWFDIWMRVVPADSSEPSFDAFVNQGVTPAQAHLIAEGVTQPVAYDPRTGIAILARNDASLGIGPGTIRRFGAMRRRNRRAGVHFPRTSRAVERSPRG